MTYLNLLKTDGIVKVDNFAFVSNLIPEFDRCISNSAVKYPPGRAARIGRDQYGRIPAIVRMFSTSNLRDLTAGYLGAEANFLFQVFMSHEQKVLPIVQWARNLHLHFDPYRALKFMIYLTDVTKQTGAFCGVPGSQNIGRLLRGRNDLKTNLATDSYTLEAHPDFHRLTDKVVYFEGKAGTLLIFDTDIIHGGGVLETGERKVIIAHNR